MAIQTTRPTVTPQPIPTNTGDRTFAAPPKTLQETITPNELFFVRNHWKGAPSIDIATYRLVVDGEVEHAQSLSYEALRQMPQKRFEVTFECCVTSPTPENWRKETRIAGPSGKAKAN